MREEEIRKRSVFDRYLELVRADVKGFFDFASFVKVVCPGCRADHFVDEFVKDGFTYGSCKECGTLFVNPRPPFEVLNRFYSESPSTQFWVNEFFKPVAEVRREQIFRPRAEHVHGILGAGKGLVIGDIGAGFGIFLEELRALGPDHRYVAIEPSKEMADICREKGLEVREVCLEDLEEMNGAFDFLTAFELAEHVFDPEGFFQKAYQLLKPGGHFLLTTLSGKGFDTLLLWERSKSISPPHHLNFFNPRSIERLLKRLGFEAAECVTPGRLDWDIVEGMIRKDGVSLGRFWDHLCQEGTEQCKAEIQAWISRNRLSSHMRVLARRPKEA